MKTINKFLYYFGYAPIKLSHEVRTHYVQPENNDVMLNYEQFRQIIMQTHGNFDKLDGYDNVSTRVALLQYMTGKLLPHSFATLNQLKIELINFTEAPMSESKANIDNHIYETILNFCAREIKRPTIPERKEEELQDTHEIKVKIIDDICNKRALHSLYLKGAMLDALDELETYLKSKSC